MDKKTKILFLAMIFCRIFGAAGGSQGAYFVDNAAQGCTNGSATYNPQNHSCAGGSDTVYTSWANAIAAVPEGTENSPVVVNVREGTYTEVGFITKNRTTWQKYDTNHPDIAALRVRAVAVPAG